MQYLTKSDLQSVKTIVEQYINAIEWDVEDTKISIQECKNMANRLPKFHLTRNEIEETIDKFYKDIAVNKYKLKKLARLQYNIKKQMKQGQ